jgi:hypothetical protein
MAPKLTIQIPPLQPLYLSLNQKADPRISFVNTKRPRDKTGLQQKLDAVVERVVGEAINPDSDSDPNKEERTTNEDHDNDDDLRSDYGDEDEPQTAAAAAVVVADKSTMRRSIEAISSPSSYIDLASENPYTLTHDAAEDANPPPHTVVLSHSLSPSPSPSSLSLEGEEDKHQRDAARLAWQLDRAYAAIVAEEVVALRALRERTRLDA